MGIGLNIRDPTDPPKLYAFEFVENFQKTKQSSYNRTVKLQASTRYKYYRSMKLYVTTGDEQIATASDFFCFHNPIKDMVYLQKTFKLKNKSCKQNKPHMGNHNSLQINIYAFLKHQKLYHKKGTSHNTCSQAIIILDRHACHDASNLQIFLTSICLYMTTSTKLVMWTLKDKIKGEVTWH